MSISGSFRRTIVAALIIFLTGFSAKIVFDKISLAIGDSEYRRLVRDRVRHVVIVIQENRSFDNLFYDFPGADSAKFAKISDGSIQFLKPVGLAAGYDLDNSLAAFRETTHDGKMDRYDWRAAFPRGRADVPLPAAQYPALAFVPKTDVLPYWELANQFVLADHMFPTNFDQSYAAHLFLIAGSAGRAVDVPDHYPWGCDAQRGTRVALLSPLTGKVDGASFPCFSIPTIADQLDKAGRTWRYYAPLVSDGAAWRSFRSANRKREAFNHRSANQPSAFDQGQLWSAFDSIPSVRFGPAWDHVISPPAQALSDIRNGKLADVTWIVPDWKNSDHPFSRSSTGPSWVAAIVNEIGVSKFWRETVVVVVWDDSGGWFDHVTPPQVDYNGLGVRVPLLIVSPYAKHGVVSRRAYEFGSILRLIEAVCGLNTMANSDKRAADLTDAFDFYQTERTFKPIGSKFDFRYFTKRQKSSKRAPDTD